MWTETVLLQGICRSDFILNDLLQDIFMGNEVFRPDNNDFQTLIVQFLVNSRHYRRSSTLSSGGIVQNHPHLPRHEADGGYDEVQADVEVARPARQFVHRGHVQLGHQLQEK